MCAPAMTVNDGCCCCAGLPRLPLAKSPPLPASVCPLEWVRPGPLFSSPQSSGLNNPPALTGPSGCPRLPAIPYTGLAWRRPLGGFGNVDLMVVVASDLEAAVKSNGTDCVDDAAIDNEQGLDEHVLGNPHDNIVPVYGICLNAPDGKVRIVMKYCKKGSLYDYLVGTARPEVSRLSVPNLQSFWSHTVFAWCTHPQGGLTMGAVLAILKQAVVGLMHLHAANLLIDSLDPLWVMVADFGVSHRLSAFATGAAGRPGPVQVCVDVAR